jgi:hypothetical protein
MGTDPIRAAALAAATVFCAGYIFYRVRAGDVRHGDLVYTRSNQPAQFWFSVLPPTAGMLLIALAMATDMGSNDLRFDQSVTCFLGAILIGFLLIRALRTGQGGGHRISFERREEPREYWTIVLLYCAAEGLAIFMLIHALRLPPS